MKVKTIILFTILSICFSAWGFCATAENIEVLLSNQKAKMNVEIIDEGRILVSATDFNNNPIKGLKAEDFIVKQGNKRARVITAETLETKREVGLNIVLVVDNSFSMKERNAVKSLLSALDEFLKIIRPIDRIEVITFDSSKEVNIRGHELRINSFKSSNAGELRKYFKESLSRRLSSGTYLYEAILGGVHSLRKLPAESHKFLVVFTDGADINSDIEEKEIETAARGMANLHTYTIDFMPTKKTNKFLKSFSKVHGGQIWKVTAATRLLPIFKSVSSTLLHRYVVEYKILKPPRGNLRLGAYKLNFDILTTLDGKPLPYYVFFETGKSTIHPNYYRFKSADQTGSFRPESSGSALDKYKHILNLTGHRLKQNQEASVQIIGCNSNQGVEKNNLNLSNSRAESVQAYLNKVWGISKSRMNVVARNLPFKFAPSKLLGSRIENQRVEIVFEPRAENLAVANDFNMESANNHNLEILSEIEAEYGLANWELSIKSKDRVLKKYQGKDDLKKSYMFPLGSMNAEKLKNMEYVEAHIKVTDIYNDTLTTSSSRCPVTVAAKTAIHEFIPALRASVSLKPATITIEEVTMINSSPLLNYVFFETGKSQIPERYFLLKGQSWAKKFDESLLRDTMSKYYNVLNIIGKRLTENPQAKITLVGCISNIGKEKGRIDLSRGRAEEIRAYFRYIWQIDNSRITVKARKRPAVPSSSKIKAGRVENQRVEILSDTPAILDSIKSKYVEEKTDSRIIEILPDVQAGYDLTNWQMEIIGDGRVLESLQGQGNDIPNCSFDITRFGLKKIGNMKKLSASLKVSDASGRSYSTQEVNYNINYIKRKERAARKQDFKVLEKYALILFDYNSAAVKDSNKVILDRVIQRIKELPEVNITIVGHTDNTGKKQYNVNLSYKRAKAVYHQIRKSRIAPGKKITFRGDGPVDPPYENEFPEGRSFNRTVTILLEYEGNE